jgi:CsoR family transcriptional regulator, copper-sensing transcriptional repressor
MLVLDRGIAEGSGEDSAVASYTKDRDAYLNRLRRIEGQIRGLQRMVEQDQYCINVLTQVSAATKALQSFALALLEEHMATCVVDAAADRADAAVKVKEAADAIARLVRS